MRFPPRKSIWVPFIGISWLFLISGFVTAQSPAPIKIPTGLTVEQVNDGWISLFDGESLFGWTPVTEANWQVKDGEIRVSEGKRGLLRTTSQFSDFEMTAEFKADEQTNSGIFLRTSPTPKKLTADCYELNIADMENPFPTGSFVARQKTRMLTAHVGGKWHKFRIEADGPKMKVWLDDELVMDYKDPAFTGRGYIGLQFNSGNVAFRNIHLKPKTDSVLDSELSNHWKDDQKLDSKIAVNEQGELRITGGKGQLESKKQYGDFVFSTLCKTNSEELNSGVFFRCIPGDVMNGYESQINNSLIENDRTKPGDCGTGGIFRRTTARLVNANDQEWFAKTIITNGPHISVWVNGYQVTDWTDQRKRDANPRRGLRLEKGTIIFQGHDPTTDIAFKDIRAKELTARRPSH